MKKNLLLFNSIINDKYNEFVKKLFEYNSLINETNEAGETLLHYSCYYGLIEKYYALINMNCEIKETLNGDTLLHYACFSGHDDFLVIELIKLGISPIKINHNGENSLHLSSNEKISHYLNLWTKRNNINLLSLYDNNFNTVAHTSKIYAHVNSLYYWLNEYPELNEIKNLFNKNWKECKRKVILHCKY